MFTFMLAGLAAAQQPALDAHGMAPTDLGTSQAAPLTVPWAGPFDAGDAFGGALVEYVQAPWSVGEVAQIDELFALNAAFGIAPIDRLRLTAGAPVVVSSVDRRGEPQGATFGDIRLGALTRLWNRSGVHLGLSGGLDLPTGKPERALGAAGVGGEIIATGSLEGRVPVFTLAVGPALRAPAVDGLPHSAFVAMASLGAKIGDDSQVAIESRTEVLTDNIARDQFGTASELRLTARHRFDSGLYLHGGIGTAAARGVGSAPLRILIGAAYGKVDRPPPVETMLVRAMADGRPAVVELIATNSEGETTRGIGELTLTGIAGTEWRVETADDCLQGMAPIGMPSGGGRTELPVVAVDSERCSRPPLVVEPAGALVWVPHPVCMWLPVDQATERLALLPADTQVQVKAPGFLSSSISLDAGSVKLEPAPEQGGLVVLGSPGDIVSIDGEALPPSADGVVIVNLAEGVHDIRVTGGGRLYEDQAATVAGFATWLRVPGPEPVAVLFGSGSASIDRRSAVALRTAGQHAGRWIYEIRGSYSPEGSEKSNIALAKRRAKAVADALKASGVGADQIRIAAPAPPKPGVSASEQRRVDVKLIPGGAT